MCARHGPSQAPIMALVQSSTPALPEPGVQVRMEACPLVPWEDPLCPLSPALLPARMNEDRSGNQGSDTVRRPF